MDNNEVSLYEYWVTLKKYRTLILSILIGTFVIAAIVTFSIPNTYEAKTTFYYPLSDKGSSIGALASGGGSGGKETSSIVSALLSSHSSSLQDYTKGILESRHVADMVIDRLNLLKYYHLDSKHRSNVEDMLHQSTNVKLTIEGIMEITVTTTDPKLAADLANGYVDAFRDYSANSMVSMAKKHRLDVEKRLDQLQGKLKNAEADMANFQATYKTADFSEAGKALMESLMTLQEEETMADVAAKSSKRSLISAKYLMAKQIRAATINPLVSPNINDPILNQIQKDLSDIYVKYAQAKATETPNNPELQSYAAQLKDKEAALRVQLRRQLVAQSQGVSDDLLDPQLKTAELQGKLDAIHGAVNKLEKKFDTYPTVGIAYVQKARRLKILEALYNYLSTEYEKAKIEEAQESPDIQVLDQAVPPDHKIGPHRMTNLGIGLFLGAFLGIAAAFMLESTQPKTKVLVSNHKESHKKVEELVEKTTTRV